MALTMFFPMSWMSPKTVQITMLPFDSWAFPLSSRNALITAKLALTVSAESKSWGKNFFPISKSFPTMSNAGTMQRSIIWTGSFPSSRSFFVASADESLNPLQIMFMSALSESVKFSGNLGVPITPSTLVVPAATPLSLRNAAVGLFGVPLFAPFASRTAVAAPPIPNALNKIP